MMEKTVGHTNDPFFDGYSFRNQKELIYSHLDKEVSVMLSHLKDMNYNDVKRYYVSTYLRLDNLSKSEIGSHLLNMIDNDEDEFDISLVKERYKRALSHDNERSYKM